MFRLFLFIISLVLSTYSCSKKVDLDFPEVEKEILVHGYLSPNQLTVVNLDFSLPYNSDNETEVITNAEVVLNDQAGQTYELVYTDSLKAFVADAQLTISPGKNYGIKINVPGYKNIYAETTVPSKVEIDTIRHYPITSDYIDLERYEITFSDPPNANNYYYFYTIGGSYNQFYSDDPLLQWSIGQKDYIAFNDETIDGQSYTIILDYFFNSEDSVSFHLQTLSPEIYHYFQSIDIQHNLNEFPLDNVELNIPIAQPMQIYSNVQNAIGIFGAYNSEVKTLPAPK